MEDGEDVYIPECDVGMKPFVGKYFGSLVEAENFYVDYAKVAGFDPRKSCSRSRDGVIVHRGMVCSREGTKFVSAANTDDSFDSINNRRKRTSSRCGCKAMIFFKLVKGSAYVVQKFVEGHNHTLVEDRPKHFMRINRKIDEVHQKFIIDCAKSCIGPTHAYKLMAEFLGGPEAMGCTVTDVRNLSRDLKAFVDGSDAQMLIDAMKQKKEHCDSFEYEYQTDKDGRLIRVFWCDSISRRNYHLFGDVVAFDTTYSTNKYSMIFAPFIGKNNHGKPVTFAAGLLSKEDGDSFVWLFDKFIKCMLHPPKLIITDQCLGMKYAVEKVLTGSRHRWCMWHIMIKLADKVSKELHANEEFKNELNACVWSELIELCVFESAWGDILDKYGLTGESWFKVMFEAREWWVPAYFRDFRMSGLVRTTSISECENSFFKRYTRYRANLIEFWMQYNYALDAQRQNNARLNYVNSSSVPTMITKLHIEKHASSIYTFNVFLQVQEEMISACFNCRMTDMAIIGELETYSIEDEFDNQFAVQHDACKGSYTCEYKMFIRMGLLYRHVFFVLKNKDEKRIPEAYIVDRWLKLSNAKPVHDCMQVEEEAFEGVDEKNVMVNKVMSSFFNWLQKFEGDKDKLSMFLDGINETGATLYGEGNCGQDSKRPNPCESYYGMVRLENVEIHPPERVKTKGSGKRIISNKEKAIQELNKPLRRCKKCMKMARHDSHNCDKVRKASRTEE